MPTIDRKNDMSETPGDWTNWIITTIFAALSTMVGTVVFLAKLIETKYIADIKDLKLQLEKFESRASIEIALLKNESHKCQEERFTLAVRVAQLESKQE